MIRVRLNEIAKERGKTVADISRETGINRNTIETLMKRRVSGIKFQTLEQLCRAFKVGIADMLSIQQVTPPVSSVPNFPQQLYRQEGELMPFTCWPWASTIIAYEFHSPRGVYSFGPLTTYFKNNYGFGYWDTAVLNDLAAEMYESYRDPRAFKKIYRKFEGYAAHIEELYDGVHAIGAEELESAEIKRLLRAIRTPYEGFWQTSLFIDAFDPGFDVGEIKRLAEKHALTQDEVVILTTPTEMTFADARKLSFLKLAKKILRGQIQGRNDLQKRLARFKLEIEAYQRAYGYVHSNYVQIGHISLEEMEAELQPYLHDKALLEQELERLTRYVSDHERAERQVLQRRRLPSNPLWFFGRLTFWREERKRINLMGIHVLDVILRALEARTGIPKKDLGYLSFDEVDLVLKGLVTAGTLAHRREQGILVFMNTEGYRIWEGDEAASLFADLEAIVAGESHPEKVIRGQTACQGHARGVARVILTQADFARFKTGEILVTGMTRPEFLPLMQKAAAIVTNEGGITCHAAIVSRELGKPCIIGTKNATKVIGDGDMVEVRASHGTVRILEAVDRN